jgi:hypothetical protein
MLYSLVDLFHRVSWALGHFEPERHRLLRVYSIVSLVQRVKDPRLTLREDVTTVHGSENPYMPRRHDLQ